MGQAVSHSNLLELSHPSRARVSLVSSRPTFGVTFSSQMGLPFPKEIKEPQIVFLRRYVEVCMFESTHVFTQVQMCV